MQPVETAVDYVIQACEALAEAHVSLGRVASKYEWNWAEAEREFQMALSLDPNSATAHL